MADGEQTTGVVRTATADDVDEMVETLALAFERDPVMCWAYGDDVRLTRLRGLWGFMAGRAYVPRGASTVIPGDAAALWLPAPGQLEDEFWAENASHLMAGVDGDIERLSLFSAMVAEHHPHEPHRYLLAIGVRPDRQGAGLGNVLLHHTCSQADAAGEVCYLEATSDSSRRLYERHGFTVTAEVRLPEGPTVWPMTRPPRTA